MGTCPIVTIKTKNGHCDINQVDFDESIHEIFEPEMTGKKNDGPEMPGKKNDIIELLVSWGIPVESDLNKPGIIKLFEKAVKEKKYI